MIHDPKLLIKLIVRMIVRKLGIMHAAMVLFDPDRDSYVLSISRGDVGLRIPQNYTRFDNESPLIQLFSRKEFKGLILGRNAILSEDINRLIWRETVINQKKNNKIQLMLHAVSDQMQQLNVIASVPAYYRKKLLAVLLLGEKRDGTKFTQAELDFFAALASDAAMAIRNAQLFRDLEKEASRNRELFIQTIKVLGSAIEAKDAYTHGHTERVTKYALAIARRMVENGSAEFPEVFFENLYISGLLHDIGKIAVPELILNKTGRLTVEEYALMKTHPVRGAEMVQPLNLPRDCIDGIRFHHERYDGLGYPDGLLGEAIPVTASVMAVADAFDAMTSDRPYRKGLTQDEGIEEIRRNLGTQFHPLPARAMLELYEAGQLNSIGEENRE